MSESQRESRAGDAAAEQSERPSRDHMAWIPGGTFRMGSDHHYPEERPAHSVHVDGFRMDRCAVTNAQFARFVVETGYTTLDERPLDLTLYPNAVPELAFPGALVFHMTTGPVNTSDLRNSWRYIPDTCWKFPEGPGSDVEALQDHPVVHVAQEEAEWERAASGGLDGAGFMTALRYGNWKLLFDTQAVAGTFKSIPAQKCVAAFLMTFKDYPPRQKAASFTIDQLLQMMLKPTDD